MDQQLKERLLVTLGYMRGLNGKVIGSGGLMGVERMYVPSEVMSPLEELLFPNPTCGVGSVDQNQDGQKEA